MSAPNSEFPYATHLNVLFNPLEKIALDPLVGAVQDAWFNQTLVRVNESVVRFGVMILKRSLIQIGIGAIIGLPIAARIVHLTVGSTVGQSPVISVLMAMGLAASLVLIVAMISCTIPTRRILAVEASEAMRAEG